MCTPEMAETRFSYGGYFVDGAFLRRTPRSQTTSAGFMEQSGPKLRSVWSARI